MRNSSEITIKEALEQMFSDYRISRKVDEARVVSAWTQVAGKLIARHTEKIYVKDQALYVKADNAALKHELSYHKTDLIRKLNKAVGKEVVKEMVLL